jgi:eukaryotic-like serine/threonine-protein kinase
MSDATQTLGKYQIIREIARSNDIVYEAYDPIMNRRVALKELAMPGGLNPKQQEDRHNRFLREARAAGTLTHPNIVTIYEYGEDSGRNYIAMEYLDGHTLRNELDTHGFLPLARSVEIAKAVLEALDYAHKNGVIHRDIKPENVQLLSDGRIKITDFGIARLTFEPNITMDGQVFGTPSYMSPEQVVGREIDARSDLFSLGVVLYEMIAGRKPFAGDSVVSITYAIMNAEPEQPNQANYAVWQVLQRAMDKSPALRYAHAEEMQAALEEAERASMAGSPVLDPMTTGNPYATATPTYNPYGQALPNPQFQVGNAPPPGNPYLYNPYGPPQPYGGQQAPPPSYPFNPYAPQPPGAPAPTGMQAPGFPPVPVYYPPPPKPPLITPEMKAFTGRVFVAFLVLGTLLALGVVATKYFSEAYGRYQQEKAVGAAVPQGGPSAMVPPSAGAPPGGVAVQPNRSAAETAPAPSNPSSSGEVSPPPTPVYDYEAADRHYRNAMALLQESRHREAREELYEARKLLPPDSPEFQVVQSLIDQLTGA